MALITLMLLGFTFEIYLRNVGFLEAQPANYPCIAGDPVLNHVFHRNCEGVALASALKTATDVTYKTNSLGYRGHEPIEGKQTIVVIGDSYTEGFGLSENDTFPSQLERALTAKGAGRWQVLNGGTLGFSPALYTKYFDKYFLNLSPEVVLLNLDFTDFNDDPYYLQIAEYDAAGYPSTFPGREIFPDWSLGLVYSNKSALVRFLHQELNQWSLVERRNRVQPIMDMLVTGEALVPVADLEESGMSGCKKTVEVIARHLLALKSRVEAVGGKLFIHMYPPGYLIKNYATQPQNISFVRSWDQKNRKDYSWACSSNPRAVEMIRKLSARVGVLFFNSFPVIMEHPEKETLYFDRDAHWTPKGVGVVTRTLSAKLLPFLKK